MVPQYITRIFYIGSEHEEVPELDGWLNSFKETSSNFYIVGYQASGSYLVVTLEVWDNKE